MPELPRVVLPLTGPQRQATGLVAALVALVLSIEGLIFAVDHIWTLIRDRRRSRHRRCSKAD